MSNVFLLYVFESFKEKDGVERVLSPWTQAGSRTCGGGQEVR